MQLDQRLWSFNRGLDDLGSRIAALDRVEPLSVDEIFMLERLLLQLQINWDHFVRSIILDSATGRFENTSGPVLSSLPSPPKSRESAAHRLVSLYPRRSFEPDWYLPNEAIDAASRLQVSNLPEISAYLGTSPWLISELRHIRNFVSHRTKRSALSLRTVLPVRSLGSQAIVNRCFDYSHGGSQTYAIWISFMKTVAHGMAT